MTASGAVVASPQPSAVSLLDELDQGPEAALGVDEGDGRTARAGPGCLVDRRRPGGDHRGERGRAVVDPVPDVMEPLALLGEVLGDRRVLARRRGDGELAVGGALVNRIDGSNVNDAFGTLAVGLGDLEGDGRGDYACGSSTATTTRAMPAAISASAQGGVVP